MKKIAIIFTLLLIAPMIAFGGGDFLVCLEKAN